MITRINLEADLSIACAHLFALLFTCILQHGGYLAAVSVALLLTPCKLMQLPMVHRSMDTLGGIHKGKWIPIFKYLFTGQTTDEQWQLNCGTCALHNILRSMYSNVDSIMQN